MPCSTRKARVLLKQGKAKVVKREPFTIQLKYATGEAKQDITLGVDAGSDVVGLSATTVKAELYSGEVKLRNDISKLILTKRQNRRTRRSVLRYRKPRFLNRIKSKHKGWLSPSVEHKINTHIKIIADIHNILPIKQIIVETAQFDIHKIINPEVFGKEYQKGVQQGYTNVKDYVLFRDNYVCQYCKGKSKEKRLEVHHIKYRSQGGGNSPNNLITLCKTCHDNLHKGEILITKQNKNLSHPTFMGIMRKTLLSRLRNIYPYVFQTYGYITKDTRIRNNLPKEHRVDARCISGNPQTKPLSVYYYQKKVRCHNRQIHKSNFIKGHRKKLNQAQFEVKGFRLFDKVEFESELYYIFGRRATGFFDIRRLDGTKVNKGSVSCKKLTLVEFRKTILCERRMQGFECIGRHSSTTLKG